MATVVFGGGVANIVGSHAGNTFSRNRGGSYVKRKPLGLNPRSTKQMVTRTRVGQLAKEYTYQLSDAQRLQWRTFASTNPVINRIGNTAFLSGQQMYAKLNANLLQLGTPSSATPPLSAAVTPVVSLTIVATAGGPGTLFVTINTPGSPGGEVGLVWASPVLNPGRNYVSSQLRLIASGTVLDSSFNLWPEYVQAYGAGPGQPGMRLFIRAAVVNSATGVRSAYFQDSVLWV